MQTGVGAKTFALAESTKSLFENSDEGIMLIKKAKSIPKLEKRPNSNIGATDVKQKEKKPANVVRAARETGRITPAIAFMTKTL